MYSSEPWLNPPEYDDPLEVEESLEIDVNLQVRAYDSGLVDLVKDDTQYDNHSQELRGIPLAYESELADDVWDAIVDDIPSENGVYHITGRVSIPFTIYYYEDKYGDISGEPEVCKDSFYIEKHNIQYNKIGD